MYTTNNLFAKKIISRHNIHLWGAPGAPIIRMRSPKVPQKFKSYDMFVEYTHRKRCSDLRLLQYLGKHCPHPQKSLWSPDTPVMQDRHLFMLTTIDIDAFKYWFGVKRCLLSVGPWKILAKSGLLPPVFNDNSSIMPKPIFDKEQLMKYYLANRKPLAVLQREKYLAYENSIVKSLEEREADWPKPPYL